MTILRLRSSPDTKWKYLTSATAILLAILPIAATIGPLLNFATGIPVYPLVVSSTAILLLVSRSIDHSHDKWLSLVSVVGATWAVVAIARIALGVEDLPAAFSAISVLLPNILIVVCCYRHPFRWTFLAYFVLGWLISAVVTVSICAWEVLSGSHMSNVSESVVATNEWFIAGPFGNPNALAYYCCALFPLFFVFCFIRGISFLARMSMIAGALAVLIVLALTQSVIGLIATLIQLSLFFIMRSRKGRSIRALVVTLIVLIVSSLSLINFYSDASGPSRVPGLVHSTFDVILRGIQGEPNTIGVRIALLEAAGRLSIIQPLAGHGAGQFPLAIVYYDKTEGTGGVLSPHNGVGEMAVEYGLLVSLLVVVSVSLLLRAAYQTSKSSFGSLMRFGTLCFVIGVSQALLLTANSTYLQSPWSWMWVVLSVLGCTGTKRCESEATSFVGRFPACISGKDAK